MHAGLLAKLRTCCVEWKIRMMIHWVEPIVPADMIYGQIPISCQQHDRQKERVVTHPWDSRSSQHIDTLVIWGISVDIPVGYTCISDDVSVLADRLRQIERDTHRAPHFKYLHQKYMKHMLAPPRSFPTRLRLGSTCPGGREGEKWSSPE